MAGGPPRRLYAIVDGARDGRVHPAVWGKSWGIFVVSTGTLEEMRRHFRRFLRVQDEGGKRLVFRYYDPRVLRVYLPTCNAGELRTIFGPVSLYLLEGEDPAELVQYHRDDAGLGKHVARLAGTAMS